MASLKGIITDLVGKVEQSVSVLVARQAGDALEARKLNVEQQAADSFRDLCRNLLTSLQNRTSVPYSSEADLADSQVFVLDDSDNLSELASLANLPSVASTLPDVAPGELDISIQLYGVVVGNADRAMFVRRVDPTLAFKSGGFLATGSNQLERIEEPAFSFFPGFDLVISDEWAVIVNQRTFERMFREIGLVERHIGEWVTGITDHLPMNEQSSTDLRTVAIRDSRVWRKLKEIKARNHLAGVTLDQVREYAVVIGLDPAKIIQDDHLVFDQAQRFSFLHLLNEDLYRGPLTNEAFEAQRKALAT